MAKGIVVEEEWKENFRLSRVISAMSFVYLSNIGGLVTQSNTCSLAHEHAHEYVIALYKIMVLYTCKRSI